MRILGENWEESCVNLCKFFLTYPNVIGCWFRLFLSYELLMSFRLIDSVWLFLEEDCYRSKIVLSSVLTIIQPTKIYELLYDLIGSAISNLSVHISELQRDWYDAASQVLKLLWKLTCRSSPVLLNDKSLQRSRVFAVPYVAVPNGHKFGFTKWYGMAVRCDELSELQEFTNIFDKITQKGYENIE